MGRFPIRLIGLGKQIDFLGRHMDYVESSTSGDTYFSIYRGVEWNLKDIECILSKILLEI